MADEREKYRDLEDLVEAKNRVIRSLKHERDGIKKCADKLARLNSVKVDQILKIAREKDEIQTETKALADEVDRHRQGIVYRDLLEKYDIQAKTIGELQEQVKKIEAEGVRFRSAADSRLEHAESVITNLRAHIERSSKIEESLKKAKTLADEAKALADEKVESLKIDNDRLRGAQCSCR